MGLDLAQWTAGAELLVPVLVVLTVSLQRWKTGMRDAWRDEAEAYRARAERLDEEVQRLVAEVRALREENAELQEQVRALLAQG